MPIWRHLRAILLLPGTVLVVVPAIILRSTHRSNPGEAWPLPFNIMRWAVSLSLIGLGLTLMAQTIRLFMAFGEGTLSPLDSTRRLVVRGPYRHVRNPMISGACCILLGEATWFRSVPLLLLFLSAVLLNVVYIPLVEERGLEQRFGEDYRAYKRSVPRWIPRRQPWTPPWESQTGDVDTAD
ncbi:MAG TPA: isoprenylcysteine carboxylmethyltransferase family protein [Ardenticatenaceae bacterium]